MRRIAGFGEARRRRDEVADQSLEDLLNTIADDFVGSTGDRPDEALAAYRRDHLWATG
jgi:hypothetical protein